MKYFCSKRKILEKLREDKKWLAKGIAYQNEVNERERKLLEDEKDEDMISARRAFLDDGLDALGNLIKMDKYVDEVIEFVKRS